MVDRVEGGGLIGLKGVVDRVEGGWLIGLKGVVDGVDGVFDRVEVGG